MASQGHETSSHLSRLGCGTSRSATSPRLGPDPMVFQVDSPTFCFYIHTFTFT